MHCWLLCSTANCNGKLFLYVGSHAWTSSFTQSIKLNWAATHNASWMQISSVTGIKKRTHWVWPFSPELSKGADLTCCENGFTYFTHATCPICAATLNARLNIWVGFEMGIRCATSAVFPAPAARTRRLLLSSKLLDIIKDLASLCSLYRKKILKPPWAWIKQSQQSRIEVRLHFGLVFFMDMNALAHFIGQNTAQTFGFIGFNTFL